VFSIFGQVLPLSATLAGVSVSVTQGTTTLPAFPNRCHGRPGECDHAIQGAGDFNGDGKPNLAVAHNGRRICAGFEDDARICKAAV
jgi:hypothetical protein